MSRPVTNSKRRARNDEAEQGLDGNAAEARKRRAFLQTMGQQLREFGAQGTSPQDHARHTFGTSPLDRPRTHAGEPSTASVQHVETPENDGAPGEDDQIPAGAAKGATKWLWNADEVRPITNGTAVQRFTFEDLLDWSQAYFDHWHPAFPFVHAPSLLDYFRQIASGASVTATSPPSSVFQSIILRSIMSISVADRRQMKLPTKALPPALVFHSFNDAIKSTMSVLTEESSISSLQALVSVQLWLLTMHRYNAASRLEGLAVRIAFQLDLHKCPSQTHSKDAKEIELRKRLFWSIYCIDRYICIRLGNPLGMRSDDTDVCYPHTENHGSTGTADQKDEGNFLEFGDFFKEHKAYVSTDRDDRLDLLEFLAQHASIRGAIMENRNKSVVKEYQHDMENVMQVEAEHAKWWNTVDEYLSNDEQAQSITKIHQVTLIVLRFESIVALHRSLLAASRKDTAYNAALQRSISASRSIINTLHKALKGFGAFDGSPGVNGYESTPLLWPSFTWAVWMSTFIIISAATEEQIPRNVALRLADRSIEILGHLALRGTGWPEACIVAIENLTARLNGVSTRSSSVGPGNSSSSTLPNNQIQQQPNTFTGFQDSRNYGNRRLPNYPARQHRNAIPAVPPFVQNSTQDLHSSTIDANYNDPIFDRTHGNLAHGMDLQYRTNLASVHLGGVGDFLGIAQQSSDNPRPSNDIMQLFNGEDLTSWMGNNVNFNGSW